MRSRVCVPSARACVPISAPVAAGYVDSDVAQHRRGLLTETGVCVSECVGTVMGSGTRGLWSTGPGLVARTAIRTLISTCHSEQLQLSQRGKERERQGGISRDNVDTELL